MAHFIELPKTPISILKKYNRILRKLNITHIVTDRNSNNEYMFEIFNYMNNPNMIILVIESMSLGICMSRHFASQFDYITQIVDKYDGATNIFHYPIPIYTVNLKWDTHKWCFLKLRNFPQMMDFINNRTMKELKELPEDCYQIKAIDFHFLESLSWKSPHEIEQHE